MYSVIIDHERDLDSISFYKKQILYKVEQNDLLTMEDMDQHKLPAVDTLLKTMLGFYAEMASIGIQLKEDKSGERSYILTDTRYEHFEPFKIILRSSWFDPKYGIALHAGFSFFAYVIQDWYRNRSEIADWIKIQIQHFDTTPTRFASHREHVRGLHGFIPKEESYFEDLKLPFKTHVSFKEKDNLMTFKADAFNTAVHDACAIMRKIVSHKTFLKVIEEND